MRINKNQLIEKQVLNDVIEWDIVNWSSTIKFWENHSKPITEKSLVLEIGSRNGGLSLYAALKGAKVICSDLNQPTMEAKLKHKKYGVSHLIKYKKIDATNIPYNSSFDKIIFKSVLGGIGRYERKDLQSKAINEMYKALKIGGQLIFAENLIGSPFHQFFRNKFIKWGNIWRYISLDEMNEFLLPFSNVKSYSCGFLGTFGRTKNQKKILGLLDNNIFNNIVRNTWHYILIGVATK